MSTAQPRVPRSRVDEFYLPSDPLDSTTMGSAVVASVEGDTATVVIGDETVPGVVFQGDAPVVGEMVEVESRGDLLVIPNWFVEGISSDTPHIVSDDAPGHLTSTINLGGLDPDNWEFLPPDTGNWTDEAGTGALRVRSHPSTLLATNHLTNPQPEAALAPWGSNTLFGGATLATVTLDAVTFETGTKSVKAAWPAAWSPATATQSNVLAQSAVVPANTRVTLSVRVFVPTGSPAVAAVAAFFSEGLPTDVKDQWTWVHTTFTTPDDGTPKGYFCGAITHTPGGSCYVDRAILRPGEAPTETDLIYFDGDTVDTATETFSWTGAVGSSTSTRTLGQAVVGPGELWSTFPFDVVPGDLLSFDALLTLLAGTAPTAQLVMAWAPEGEEVWSAADVQVTAYGAAVTVNAADVVLTALATVPQQITTTNDGTITPRRARVGIRFTGGTDVDVAITSATMGRSTADWPLGTVWFDPGAEVGGLNTSIRTAQQSPGVTVDLPNTTVTAPVPGSRKIVFTAPPEQGGILMLFGMFVMIAANSNNVGLYLSLNTSRGDVLDEVRCTNAPGSGSIQMPMTIVDAIVVGPGESLEAWIAYRYAATPGATTNGCRAAKLTAVFIAGGVVAGTAPMDPMTRYFDGDSWTPDLLRPAVADVSQLATVAPPSKTPTTTTIVRAPGTVPAGEWITLTATVSPAAADGTVTFYKSNSSSGPWDNVGSVVLDGTNTAVKTVSPAVGSWWFKATYTGSATHASSTIVTSAVATVTGQWTTKSKTVTATWVQAYNGTGNQISGSGQDGAVQQGYFSATHGNRKSLLRFDLNLPPDAEVTKVVLKCSNWTHWYYNGGGTLRVGWHDKTNKPSTFGVGAGDTAKSSHSINTGAFSITLGWADAVVVKSAFKGFSIGPGNGNSLEFYGYAASGTNPWKVEVTYRTQT